jgi:hypothetical protein
MIRVTRSNANGITIEGLSANEYILLRASIIQCREALGILKIPNIHNTDVRLSYLISDLPLKDIICQCVDGFICEMHGGPEVNN